MFCTKNNNNFEYYSDFYDKLFVEPYILMYLLITTLDRCILKIVLEVKDMKINKNIIASLIYIIASICFFISYFVGRNLIFLSIGILMLVMFVMFYRKGRKENNEK